MPTQLHDFYTCSTEVWAVPCKALPLEIMHTYLNLLMLWQHCFQTTRVFYSAQFIQCRHAVTQILQQNQINTTTSNGPNCQVQMFKTTISLKTWLIRNQKRPSIFNHFCSGDNWQQSLPLLQQITWHMLGYFITVFSRLSTGYLQQ